MYEEIVDTNSCVTWLKRSITVSDFDYMEKFELLLINTDEILIYIYISFV